MRRVLIPAILAMTPATAATAQDFFVYGGAALQFYIEPDGAGSDNATELSGYVEIEKAGFYAGIWAEIANESVTTEVDLYLGYRGETAAGLGYDIGYTRYFYPDDGGDCCGELTLGLSMGFGDALSGSFDLAYDPQAELANAYLGVAYQFTDSLSASANYGFYETGSSTEQEWDIGVGYAVGEESAIDVRFYDGTDYTDGYVGLELSWDTTLFSQ